MTLSPKDIFFCHLGLFPDSICLFPGLPCSWKVLCAKLNPQPPMKSRHVLPQPVLSTLHLSSQTHLSLSSSNPKQQDVTRRAMRDETLSRDTEKFSNLFFNISVYVQYKHAVGTGQCHNLKTLRCFVYFFFPSQPKICKLFICIINIHRVDDK